MKLIPIITLIPCALFNAAAQNGSETMSYSYNGNPVSIPTESFASAALAEIFVPTATRIESVRVQVIADYPATGDLEVYLVSPQGTEITLLDNNCGSLANINTTFDDAGPTKFAEFCPAEAGRGPFRPEEALSGLRGQISAGYWGLYVVNNESDSRAGVIRGFSLSLTGTRVTTPSFTADSIVNSARGEGGVIAPGELASIFGVALGAEENVTAPSLPLPTSLGGTAVLINGTEAPILNASSGRIDFQVPFNVAPGTVATVQVRTSSGISQSTQIEVVPAFAGVYTVPTNGRGQAVASNQDGNVNSSANPARVGSYVSLYATGLGAVTPAATAGAAGPSNPLGRVSDIAVLVGGVPANVTYAGLAPGLVGTYQINFVVPANLVPGARSVVVLPAQGYMSQSRTYIFVQ